MKTKDHFRCHPGLQVSPTSRTVEQGLPVRPRQLELYGPSWNECMHDDDKLNQTAIGTLEEQELGHTRGRERTGISTPGVIHARHRITHDNVANLWHAKDRWLDFFSEQTELDRRL